MLINNVFTKDIHDKTETCSMSTKYFTEGRKFLFNDALNTFYL